MARHALIIGGARGIGYGIATRCLDDGWRVTIAGRRSRAEDLEVRGAAWLQADVSDPTAAAKLIEDAGEIDALVVCSGPYHRVPLLKETAEGWRSMFTNNLDPVFFLAQAALPGMKERGFGRIITFSMANAERLQANPFVAAHYIAKVGVLVLTRTLAKAGGKWGVTANTISPGFIDSGSATPAELESMIKHIPAKRIGTVDEAAAAAAFLLSDDAGYVNGTNVVVSGGWGI
ncbi:MAG: SDR family oxidoreductase [Proteobacteria bacterium]|nr:SDR family oxidoreductase [Pseudomonadota bacterium]